jgi:DNA-directed RNA polymerase specialized sigma24 family protein
MTGRENRGGGGALGRTAPWRAGVAQSGDRDPLGAIYAALAPAVLGYLSARGERDPEVMTGDVFVTVPPRIAQVHGGIAGLRTFVLSVAHARVVDELRSRARRPASVLQLLREEALIVPSAYQKERCRLAQRRTAAFATEPTGPNQVWLLDLSQVRNHRWRHLADRRLPGLLVEVRAPLAVTSRVDRALEAVPRRCRLVDSFGPALHLERAPCAVRPCSPRGRRL